MTRPGRALLGVPMIPLPGSVPGMSPAPLTMVGEEKGSSATSSIDPAARAAARPLRQETAVAAQGNQESPVAVPKRRTPFEGNMPRQPRSGRAGAADRLRELGGRARDPAPRGSSCGHQGRSRSRSPSPPRRRTHRAGYGSSRLRASPRFFPVALTALVTLRPRAGLHRDRRRARYTRRSTATARAAARHLLSPTRRRSIASKAMFGRPDATIRGKSSIGSASTTSPRIKSTTSTRTGGHRLPSRSWRRTGIPSRSTSFSRDASGTPSRQGPVPRRKLLHLQRSSRR